MNYAHGWAFPAEDDFMRHEIRPDGSYQLSHLEMALKYVTDWSVAGDIGAHVGTWSKPMSERFGRVLAFEPSEDTFEALNANMATFGCQNVETHRCALGATSGRVSMAPLDGRAAALKNTGARYVQDGGKIRRITIDSLELPSLGFLKMDVEGSEPAIIEGAAATLRRCRPIVLYENKGFCRRFGYKPDAARTLLEGMGYRFLEAAGCDLIFGPATQAVRP